MGFYPTKRHLQCVTYATPVFGKLIKYLRCLELLTAVNGVPASQPDYRNRCRTHNPYIRGFYKSRCGTHKRSGYSSGCTRFSLLFYTLPSLIVTILLGIIFDKISSFGLSPSSVDEPIPKSTFLRKSSEKRAYGGFALAHTVGASSSIRRAVGI